MVGSRHAGHSLLLCGSASLGSCVTITTIKGPERRLLNWAQVLRKHTQRPVGRLAMRHLKGGMVGVSQSPHGTGSTGSLHITLGVVEGTGG